MRRRISLYIGGQLADLDNQSFILLNYTMEELQNPVIVKNSFSQQITLKGTPNNNRIFGDIFRNDRVTEYSGLNEDGIYFDPNRKTSFSIYNEAGEILESGYLKLDRITMKRKMVEYTCTLYGGLGSFLYGLSYDSNGDKLTLADLDFGETLDFTINRSTVASAWQSLADNDQSGKWTIINFMPSAYLGLPPSPFDANKGIVVNSMVGLPEKDGDYAVSNGMSLVTLSEKVTAQETKDYRSYLQKPLIRLKSVIQAICNPSNNGGWTVNLDSEFTDSDEPHWEYWDKTWLTLPLLNDLNIDSTTTGGDDSFNGGTYTIPGGGNLSVLYNVWVDFQMLGESSVNDCVLHCEDDWAAGSPVNDNPGMYLNYLEWEVIAYDSSNQVIKQFYYRVSTQQAPEGMTQMDDVFDYLSGGLYFVKNGATWHPNISIQEYGVAKVSVTLTLKSMTWGNLRASGDPNLMFPVNTYDVTLGEYFNCYAELTGSYINYQLITSSTVRTGASITKSDLLGGSRTPADYLLSFCKMFGMHLVCHKDEKVVDILLRKNLYSSTVVDLTDRIDRKKDIIKVPFSYDSRWYTFGNSAIGEYAEYYQNKFGIPFGQMRINTGFDFNADSKSLTDSIIFSNACDILEASKYFCDLEYAGKDIPAVFLGGGKFTLYKGGESKDFDIPYPIGAEKTWLNPSNPLYDDFSKVQIHKSENGHIDERDTIVFFNGMVTPASDHITLSDDLRIMLALNGNNPCWLPNYCDYEPTWKLSSMPFFSRYSWSGSNVAMSADFGTPKEVQLPGVTFLSNSDIYSRYWQSYIGDRYDDDSAVVTAYVDLRGFQVNEELMRQFYFFDDAIWALNKIVNYSLTTWGTVECEFVKVQDTNNYTT